VIQNGNATNAITDGENEMMIRPLKKYTIKEWKKLSNLQETLCKKFDIVLIDHKTKKELFFHILDKINLKNMNKGIETFNKIIQDFGGSMEQLTSELNETSKNNIKIWSESKESQTKKSKDQINLEKLWGVKDD
jgi:hypothetical protein